MEYNSSSKAGAFFYNLLTENGKKAISKEVAANLTDKQIEAIIIYTFNASIDFENDLVALDSLQNILDVDLERHPLDIDVEESLKQFKEQYKDFFGNDD